MLLNYFLLHTENQSEKNSFVGNLNIDLMSSHWKKVQIHVKLFQNYFLPVTKALVLVE